jgi:superfamily II DNA or RNA helicase
MNEVEHKDRWFQAVADEDGDGNVVGGHFEEIAQPTTDYDAFLRKKKFEISDSGIEVKAKNLNRNLFDFQRDIVRWTLKKGRACIFCDCGLGKTIMQLEWAHRVPGKVLILAPLAVAQQSEREGTKFGIAAKYSREPIADKITLTNYEMLHRFDPADYVGVVLDESSILKSFDGSFRNQIITSFRATPFRLACTATPAPNDYMELGNHSEFVGSLTRTEMLSTFFVHDGGNTSQWRLKRHAIDAFWEWVCTWAVMMRKPSDLGYEDDGFILPDLAVYDSTVEAGEPLEGHLFALPASTLAERRKARSQTTDARASMVAKIVAERPCEPWLIWCNLNKEADAAVELIDGAAQVSGSDSLESKEEKMLGFTNGDIRILISKPAICGHGMNWQHCPNVVFLGLSDSYEQYYQAVRRVWRFGQKKPVRCYIVTAENEGAVTANIRRKEKDAMEMAAQMVKNMHEINEKELKSKLDQPAAYGERIEVGPGWEMRLADCVESVKSIETNSVHYSIFSPPFASLYTYSSSMRDMGNCRTHSEFFEHFSFLASELCRITMPGRLLSFHCMNLPISKERDGYIGIADFRGDLIRIFQKAGFIYHSEVCIWKDPVTAMQRTKALGLLYKQLRKDSCMSRQGIADYLVTMRKHGENPERVTKTHESFPVGLWQNYASPVWMDIDPSDTLQRESAREQEDERHICPLQLEVIRRAVRLWTNEGDLIFSPFAGIGSEGYEALKAGRRFLGIELKESYFQQAVLNLKRAKAESVTLFDQVQ